MTIFTVRQATENEIKSLSLVDWPYPLTMQVFILVFSLICRLFLLLFYCFALFFVALLNFYEQYGTCQAQCHPCRTEVDSSTSIQKGYLKSPHISCPGVQQCSPWILIFLSLLYLNKSFFFLLTSISTNLESCLKHIHILAWDERHCHGIWCLPHSERSFTEKATAAAWYQSPRMWLYLDTTLLKE